MIRKELLTRNDASIVAILADNQGQVKGMLEALVVMKQPFSTKKAELAAAKERVKTGERVRVMREQGDGYHGR